jgi:hypothetical protein
MDILARLSETLTPFFFSVFAGASLVGAVVLFVVGRVTGSAGASGARMSTLRPVESRAAGYLVLAFGWSVIGLLLSMASTASAYASMARSTFVLLSCLTLLFTLCFLYAGMAVILGSVTGQASEDGRWFFPGLRWLDGAIVGFGDALFDLLMARWGRGARLPHVRRPSSFGRFYLPGVSRRDEATKLAEEMQRLQDRLTAYEARLSPEQADQLRQARRIVEELKSCAP